MTISNVSISDRRIPVTILTGFLGAGKTTLLSRALAQGSLQNAAVLINEFGEVAIDHHLIREVKGDTILLAGGCACCAVHGDFVKAMMDLYTAAARGEGPAYDRVILETSGISDPSTIIAALMQHGTLSSVFRLHGVVTVVDAVLGVSTVAKHPEAAKQIALADRLLLSKCDAASASAVEEVKAALLVCNPLLLAIDTRDISPVEALLGSVDYKLRLLLPPSSTAPAHQIRSAAIRFSGPVRPGALSMWLSIMTQMHGDKLLRIKGIIQLDVNDESATPHEIHCVQHLIYPARQLAAWPSDDHHNMLVFIARGMSQHSVQSLADNLLDTLGNA
jgi:G3E family GTPase